MPVHTGDDEKLKILRNNEVAPLGLDMGAFGPPEPAARCDQSMPVNGYTLCTPARQ